jgi:hypothetical protein
MIANALDENSRIICLGDLNKNFISIMFVKPLIEKISFTLFGK